jgi:antibiotic biosynthesis monooxygenase (ABM) superfamily enzyme
VLIARWVPSGAEPEFERWSHDLTAVAARFPGFLGAGLLQPGSGGRPWQVVYRFDTSPHLDAWERSSERAAVLSAGDHLVHQSSVQRVSGLETWFPAPGAALGPPPRWKMFLVSGLCIFALQLIIYTLAGSRLQAWPLAARLACLVTLVTGAMTWIVMPVVGRRLARWLYPDGGPT